eukprot:CAMPEP_0177592068 /NCGR_PEP_ID=MMETSP0419_2-20121207/8351_1 /TAXON_ID=582737 /ORGANISM="Tetraselmis sp., Strain GSL018" /LENGTH=309 /DNA_ID=CAMNT_0019082887 /DNA_START=328 /DNA_END=1254 /DNA_ORIENTATION=+
MASESELELVNLVKAATKSAGEAATDNAEAARAVDILKQLQRKEVTLQLLAATQAGKLVKKITKNTVPEVANAAAAVVATWKQAVGSSDGPSSASQGNASSKSLNRSDSNLSTQNSGRDKADRCASGDTGRVSSGEAPKLNLTGDATRDKGRQLFFESLKLAVDEAGDADLMPRVAELAADIEEAIFSQNGGVTKEYKGKFRSLNFNLKDPKNPDLRGRVVQGVHTAHELVTLSAEELASADRRQENQKIREFKLWEAERGKADKQATTDQFQCAKCKQRKTRYFQMQTRSADEPMTTFVTCVNCGNRW